MDLTFLSMNMGGSTSMAANFGGVLIDGVPHGDVSAGSLSWSYAEPLTPTVEFILPSRPVISVVDENDEPTSDRFDAPEGRYDCHTVFLLEQLTAADQERSRLTIAMRPTPNALWHIPWVELDGHRVSEVTSLVVRSDWEGRDGFTRRDDGTGEVSWWTRNGRGNLVKSLDGRPWFAEIRFLAIPEVRALSKDEIDAVMESVPAR